MNILDKLQTFLEEKLQEFEITYQRDPHDVNRVLGGCKADVVKSVLTFLSEGIQTKDLITYPIFEFGHGEIEVAEGISQNAYALILGNNGGGTVGKNIQGNRYMTHEETLAIFKFHNVQSIDVVIARLNCLRERIINNEPIQILNAQGEIVETITPSISDGDY